MGEMACFFVVSGKYRPFREAMSTRLLHPIMGIHRGMALHVTLIFIVTIQRVPPLALPGANLLPDLKGRACQTSFYCNGDGPLVRHHYKPGVQGIYSLDAGGSVFKPTLTIEGIVFCLFYFCAGSYVNLRGALTGFVGRGGPIFFAPACGGVALINHCFYCESVFYLRGLTDAVTGG